MATQSDNIESQSKRSSGWGRTVLDSTLAVAVSTGLLYLMGNVYWRTYWAEFGLDVSEVDLATALTSNFIVPASVLIYGGLWVFSLFVWSHPIQLREDKWFSFAVKTRKWIYRAIWLSSLAALVAWFFWELGWLAFESLWDLVLVIMALTLLAPIACLRFQITRKQPKDNGEDKMYDEIGGMKRKLIRNALLTWGVFCFAFSVPSTFARADAKKNILGRGYTRYTSPFPRVVIWSQKQLPLSQIQAPASAGGSGVFSYTRDDLLLLHSDDEAYYVYLICEARSSNLTVHAIPREYVRHIILEPFPFVDNGLQCP